MIIIIITMSIIIIIIMVDGIIIIMSKTYGITMDNPSFLRTKAPGPESFDHPAGRLLRGAACAHLGSAGQSGVAWNGEWKGIGAENLVANLEVGLFLGCLMDIFFVVFLWFPDFYCLVSNDVKWGVFLLLWDRMGAKLGKDGNGTMLRLGWTMIEWTAGPNIEGNPEVWCMTHSTSALQHI
jgi:hypothetical protein